MFNLDQMIQNAIDVQTFFDNKTRDGVDKQIYNNGLMFCGGDKDQFAMFLMMDNPNFSQSSIEIIMGDDEEKKTLLSKTLFDAAKLTL